MLAAAFNPNNPTNSNSPNSSTETHAAPAQSLTDANAAVNRGDFATALRIIQPLADQGNAKAQTLLGLMYAEGSGVAQSYAEAMRWYRRAADQGDYNAQMFIGFLYRDGNGVPQDYVQSYLWLNLAAQSNAPAEEPGHYTPAQIAAMGRDDVARLMSPAQLAKAQNLAKDWNGQSTQPEPLSSTNGSNDGSAQNPTPADTSDRDEFVHRYSERNRDKPEPEEEQPQSQPENSNSLYERYFGEHGEDNEPRPPKLPSFEPRPHTSACEDWPPKPGSTIYSRPGLPPGVYPEHGPNRIRVLPTPAQIMRRQGYSEEQIERGREKWEKEHPNIPYDGDTDYPRSVC